MKICKQVYQIKIDFNITEKIQRYVYAYLITGESCYLIDSGVAGSERVIGEYMTKLGRDIKEIRSIFLTHSHPDHMGAAAAIKQLSGCQIIAGSEERDWIENIDLQFKERPIPNFYSLLNKSVKIDEFAETSSVFKVEEGITMTSMETPGHSSGSVTYILQGVTEPDVAFIGDAVPVPGDIPIFTDPLQSIDSIKALKQLPNVQKYCPAWDRAYDTKEFAQAATDGTALIEKICKATDRICHEFFNEPNEEKVRLVCQELGVGIENVNPLFKRSILSCIQ